MSQYFSSLFSRRPNEGWFRVGKYDATTVDIICALALTTMFIFAASTEWFLSLTFFPEAVREFEFWRLFTWPLVTAPNIFSLISIVFFWSFGQNIEALLGRNKFLGWVLAVTLTPALLLTALSVIVPDTDFLVSRVSELEFGISTVFLCGIWLYAATYPNVKFFEIIPIWVFAGVFTLLNVLSYTGTRAVGKIIFLAAAIGAALIVGRSMGAATGWPIPHLNFAGGVQRTPKVKQPKQRKPKKQRGGGDTPGRVVDGPWKAPVARPSGPPAAGAPAASPADQAELDGLLDKIGANGMDALSNDEKQRLNELSKRLRNR